MFGKDNIEVGINVILLPFLASKNLLKTTKHRVKPVKNVSDKIIHAEDC